MENSKTLDRKTGTSRGIKLVRETAVFKTAAKFYKESNKQANTKELNRCI